MRILVLSLLVVLLLGGCDARPAATIAREQPVELPPQAAERALRVGLPTPA